MMYIITLLSFINRTVFGIVVMLIAWYNVSIEKNILFR